MVNVTKIYLIFYRHLAVDKNRMEVPIATHAIVMYNS